MNNKVKWSLGLMAVLIVAFLLMRNGDQPGDTQSLQIETTELDIGDITRAVSLISNEIQQIMLITEQWSIPQRWALLLTRLLKRWLGGKWLEGLPEGAEILLSG